MDSPLRDMKIWIGTVYITPYSHQVPCDCSKACDIDYLWYSGWRVRLWKFLFVKFLVWSQDGLGSLQKEKGSGK